MVKGAGHLAPSSRIRLVVEALTSVAKLAEAVIEAGMSDVVAV